MRRGPLFALTDRKSTVCQPVPAEPKWQMCVNPFRLPRDLICARHEWYKLGEYRLWAEPYWQSTQALEYLPSYSRDEVPPNKSGLQRGFV